MNGKITPAEYVQLLGLQALAEKYNRVLHEVHDAAIDILKRTQRDEMHLHDQVSDFVYCQKDVKYLLEGLEVEVEMEPQPGKQTDLWLKVAQVVREEDYPL